MVVGDVNGGQRALQSPYTSVVGWVVLLRGCRLALWRS